MAASCSGAQCAACVDRRTATAILRALEVGKKCPTAGDRCEHAAHHQLRGREAGLRHVLIGIVSSSPRDNIENSLRY